MRFALIGVAAAMLATAACQTDQAASKPAASPYAKPGFYTHVHDNRLWVLKEGDKEIALVSKNQEPKVVITRIAAGPNRMTIKSNDAKVIDAYLAAK